MTRLANMPGTSNYDNSVRKSWAERHQRADMRGGRQVSDVGSSISGMGSVSIDGSISVSLFKPQQDNDNSQAGDY